jgi:hypothetical protein
MHVLQHRRLLARLALIGAAAVMFGACADQATAPQRPSIKAVAGAAHDDTPPDTECLTGWQEENGIWVCPP